MSFLGLDLFAWSLLTIFVAIIPWLGRRKIASLRRAVANGDLNARMAAYRNGIIFEWGLTIALTGIWFALGRSWQAARLVPHAAGWQWLAIFVSLALMSFFAWQAIRASGDREKLRSIRSELCDLEVFVPHTKAELRSFSWLSISAGICEELLYRGILMGSLAAAFGLVPAVLLSSLVFGLGHSYQGSAGILKTGAVGLVMALIVVFTGSLFVAMLIHAVIDLVQGRMMLAAVNLTDDGAEDIEPAGGLADAAT